MSNKKNTYNHVGRPTNDEVKERKKKKLIKACCLIGLVLIIALGAFLIIKNVNISLLKGSSTSSYMIKVQKNSKIKKVRFRPDNIDGNWYISKEYRVKNKNINTNKFSYYLFYVAGFSKDKYTYKSIEVYYNGDKIGGFASSSDFSVRREFLGKTLALKLTAKNKNNNKTYAKYLRLYVPSDLKNAPVCWISDVAYAGFTSNETKDCKNILDNIKNGNVRKIGKSGSSFNLFPREYLIYQIECNSYGIGFKNNLSSQIAYYEDYNNKRYEAGKRVGLYPYCSPKLYSNGNKDKNRVTYVGALNFTRDFLQAFSEDYNNDSNLSKKFSISIKLRPFSLKNKKDINALNYYEDKDSIIRAYIQQPTREYYEKWFGW